MLVRTSFLLITRSEQESIVMQCVTLFADRFTKHMETLAREEN